MGYLEHVIDNDAKSTEVGYFIWRLRHNYVWSDIYNSIKRFISSIV